MTARGHYETVEHEGRAFERYVPEPATQKLEDVLGRWCAEQLCLCGKPFGYAPTIHLQKQRFHPACVP